MIYTLILAATIGQTVEVPAHQPLKEEMLAYIYVHKGPDAMEKAREHFKSQSPSQIRVMYRIYIEHKNNVSQQQAALRSYQQQSALNQALLNKQKAEAYRNHLQREFQITIVQKKQQAELMRIGANMANNLMRNMNRHHHRHHHRYRPRVRVYNPRTGRFYLR